MLPELLIALLRRPPVVLPPWLERPAYLELPLRFSSNNVANLAGTPPYLILQFGSKGPADSLSWHWYPPPREGSICFNFAIIVLPLSPPALSTLFFLFSLLYTTTYFNLELPLFAF